MARNHFPLIDFGGWCRRRPRCQTPPDRRRRVRRFKHRGRGAAGAVVSASVAAWVAIAAAAAAAAPASAQVRIHEVLYDGPGTDADDAFTELTGPPGTALDGWSLVGVNGGTGTAYRTVDLTGAAIPADGVLVVATDSASDSLAAQRDVVGSVDWQNGPDAVQLVDSTGAVVDALQYGDAGAFNAGEGSPAPTAAAGKSLSRDASGTDSGDNLVDFTVLDEPTPGAGPAPAESSGDDPSPDAGDPDAGAGIRVSLPDTTAFGGDTLTVPVRFTDTSGLGLLATELFLTFDGGLLQPLDVLPADLVDTLDWQLAANVVDGVGTAIDTLRIALATDVDTLAGGGALVHARFVLADLRRPATATLHIEHLALNDGGSQAERVDGGVGLVGVDAVTVVEPSPVRMHGLLQVTVTDPDVDRDPAVRDTLIVRAREGPEDAPPEQVDTLLAVETDAASGVFQASVAVAYGTPVSASGILETAPRRQVELCFDDSLDAAGATTRRCTLLAVPAHDGRLDATVVAEPGDTLWLRLVDPDLNRRPDAVDTAFVTTVGAGAGETATAVLTEIGDSDSVFFGFQATRAADQPPDSLRLTLTPGDSLQPAYLDSTPTTGPPRLDTEGTLVVGRFGDADANGLLQAFDASRILSHVLTPVLSRRDSLAANVDSLAPFGAITPYDAALVLQHRVGLRQRFPVQASTAANHPRPESDVIEPLAPAAAVPRLAADWRRHLELRDSSDHIAVWLDDRSGIVAGDLVLQWEPGEIGAAAPGEVAFEPAADARGFLLASRPVDTGAAEGVYQLRVVLAGAQSATGPGELFRLYPRQEAGIWPGSARLVMASFNDGAVGVREARSADARAARPATFALYANHPNPFNSGTVIAFELAQPALARLEVLDLLGQPVRRLLDGWRGAGHHRVRWDGRDDGGRAAATGVYLSRLRAGEGQQMRRMLLLR